MPSDSWGQEKVRFESYLVICLALDSGVNIQVFCNVLFLFGCHWLPFSAYQLCQLLKLERLFLFQLAVAKAMRNRTGYTEEHFHLLLCQVKMWH